MAAILVILSGKHQGKRLTLPEGEAVVGRDESCQIRLATNEVSRQHCRLVCSGDQVVVHDLGSRNGTLLNDVLIQGQAELQPGDILRIGPVSLQLAGQKGATTPAKKTPSDDSIMDWLADEEGEGKSGDTTIVHRDAAPLRSPKPQEDPPTPIPAPKKFKTLGEEGEDIIQRHFELVQSGKFPKRVPALKTEK